MRINYAFNTKTGQYIVSNTFGSPNAVEKWIDIVEFDRKNEGWIVAAVSIPDNEWRRVKTALDIHNNHLEIEARVAATGANEVDLPEKQKPVVKKREVIPVKQIIITPERREAMEEEIENKKDLIKEFNRDLADINEAIELKPEGLDLAKAEDMVKKITEQLRGVKERIDYLEVNLLKTPQERDEYNTKRKAEKEGKVVEEVVEEEEVQASGDMPNGNHTYGTISDKKVVEGDNTEGIVKSDIEGSTNTTPTPNEPSDPDNSSLSENAPTPNKPTTASKLFSGKKSGKKK